MKPLLLFLIVAVAATIAPVVGTRGHPRTRRDENSTIQMGFGIMKAAGIPLYLRGKNPAQASLGSYIVSAQGATKGKRAASDPRTADDLHPGVPMTWDEENLRTLEVPLAGADFAVEHVSARYYYRIPVRDIYKSYPIYDPRSGKEPKDYLESLKKKEPIVIWGKGKAPPLKTDTDWMKAGEIVFDSPFSYDADLLGRIILLEDVRNPKWYEKNAVPVAKDGVMPFARYVIREKGKVEIGHFSCAMCHTRVLPQVNHAVVKGAQGDFPFDRAIAYRDRVDAAAAKDEKGVLDTQRFFLRVLFETPWLKPDPLERLKKMSFEDLMSTYEAIPPRCTGPPWHQPVVSRPGAGPDRHRTSQVSGSRWPRPSSWH